MTPAAKLNAGFQPPAERRDELHAAGWHQMFCPEHVPPNTRPWRPAEAS